LIALFIYRLGTHIYLPAIDLKIVSQINSISQRSLFSIIAGGSQASIFVMGVGPYITASIILQLLTVAIPKLEQIKKDGEDGRHKIEQYTRVTAILLSFIQGAGYIYGIRYFFVYKNLLVYTMSTFAIVTGSIFVMWLGEFLTEFGIGNGSSFIIFANILSGLPDAVNSMYRKLDNKLTYDLSKIFSKQNFTNVLKVFVLLVLFKLIIMFVVWIQDGERRIPVQYSKKKNLQTSVTLQNSFIPIKVNIAGVMSIIFSISLLQLPTMIKNFVNDKNINKKLDLIINFLSITNPWGTLIYIFLIFCFTFFYTSFTINPIEMAENLKKSSGVIPGIRPGKPTAEYIQNTIDKLSWIGAFFYSIIALLPVILEWIFKFKIGFGGTTLLIVTGVALEIIKQLESLSLIRHYKGFLN
jgi:preprotein translocase subunit SecY